MASARSAGSSTASRPSTATGRPGAPIPRGRSRSCQKAGIGSDRVAVRRPVRDATRSMTEPDLAHIRSRFPALARELDGRPAVFVDAPGAFATSQETDEVIAEAHRAAADLLNADADEVVFGPNATTLLFAISRSVGRTLGPGDEVVVTRLDHDANVRPWLLAAEDAGATVRWIDVRDEDVTLDLD